MSLYFQLKLRYSCAHKCTYPGRIWCILWPVRMITQKLISFLLSVYVKSFLVKQLFPLFKPKWKQKLPKLTLTQVDTNKCDTSSFYYTQWVGKSSATFWILTLRSTLLHSLKYIFWRNSFVLFSSIYFSNITVSYL